MDKINYIENLVLIEMFYAGLTTATMNIYIRVAKELRSNEGVRSSDIADLAFTSEQNVLRNMRKLKAHGFVYRDARKRWHSVAYEESIKDRDSKWILAIMAHRTQKVT